MRRHALLTILTNVVLLLTQMLAAVVLARSLGPEGRGTLATLIAWATLALTVGLLGTTDTLAYFTARSSVLRRAITAAVVGRVWIFVCLGIILFAGWAMGSGNSSEGLVTLAMVATYIAARIGLELVLSILRGTQRFGRFNAARLTSGAVPAAGFVVLAAGGRLGVNSALALYAFGSIVAILVSLGPLSLLLSGMALPVNHRAYMLFVSYSGRNLIATVATTLNRSADLLTLTITAAASDVGIYAVATAYAAPMTVVGAAAGVIALPAVQAAATAGRRRVLIRRAAVSVAALVLLGSLVAIALASELIPVVFGTEFSGAVPVSRVLVVAMSMVSMTLLTNGILRGLGRPGVITVSQGVGAAVTTGLIISWAGSDLQRAAVAALCGSSAAALIECLAISATLRSAGRKRQRPPSQHESPSATSSD